jgi:hypothetical protein
MAQRVYWYPAYNGLYERKHMVAVVPLVPDGPGAPAHAMVYAIPTMDLVTFEDGLLASLVSCEDITLPTNSFYGLRFCLTNHELDVQEAVLEGVSYTYVDLCHVAMMPCPASDPHIRVLERSAMQRDCQEAIADIRGDLDRMMENL